jgi:hypothetical protein
MFNRHLERQKLLKEQSVSMWLIRFKLGNVSLVLQRRQNMLVQKLFNRYLPLELFSKSLYYGNSMDLR